MSEQSTESADIAVTIFGREIVVTAERIREAATVLSLLTAHEPYQAEEQNTLWAANELLRDLLSTPPGASA